MAGSSHIYKSLKNPTEFKENARPLLQPENAFLSEISFTPVIPNDLSFLTSDIWPIVIRYFVNNGRDLEIVMGLSIALAYFALNKDTELTTLLAHFVEAKSQLNKISTALIDIDNISRQHLRTLNATENAIPLHHKKSTWARVLSWVPTATTLGLGIYYIVGAFRIRKEAESTIRRTLLPTCNPSSDPMWPDMNGTPGLFNVISICGNMGLHWEYGNDCDYWASSDTSYPEPFKCNLTICLNICNDLIRHAATPEFVGGCLVAGSVPLSILPCALFSPLRKLDPATTVLQDITDDAISKILPEPTISDSADEKTHLNTQVSIPVNHQHAHLENDIGILLEKSKEELAGLSVTHVINLLTAKSTLIKTWWLEQSTAKNRLMQLFPQAKFEVETSTSSATSIHRRIN